MFAFSLFLNCVRAALDSYDKSRAESEAEHEEYCTCHRCVFVRGIRGELAAFDKALAKLVQAQAKKIGKR